MVDCNAKKYQQIFKKKNGGPSEEMLCIFTTRFVWNVAIALRQSYIFLKDHALKAPMRLQPKRSTWCQQSNSLFFFEILNELETDNHKTHGSRQCANFPANHGELHQSHVIANKNRNSRGLKMALRILLPELDVNHVAIVFVC